MTPNLYRSKKKLICCIVTLVLALFHLLAGDVDLIPNTIYSLSMSSAMSWGNGNAKLINKTLEVLHDRGQKYGVLYNNTKVQVLADVRDGNNDSTEAALSLPTLTSLQAIATAIPAEAPAIRTEFMLPFYIYDNGLDWSNATFRDKNGGWLKFDTPNLIRYKHSDDYWLLKHAKQHPMRTKDPSKAKLFFVPTLLSVWTYHAMVHPPTGLCVEGVCGKALLEQADKLLHESPWFKRSQGRDHIVVATHWQNTPLFDSPTSSLYRCNLILFENREPRHFKALTGGRVRSSSFYVGTPCDETHDEKKDFAMVATLKPDISFRSRSNVCKWLQHGQNYSVSHCGKGQQCPALGQARYGFHLRGDTWGSNRLIDTLLSDVVPLLESVEQILILPDFVPWLDLVYLVDVSSEANFHISMHGLLAKRDEEYQEKLANITMYKDIFDHTKGRQFDLYMKWFAQKLELE
jgi:Exostosin family